VSGRPLVRALAPGLVALVLAGCVAAAGSSPAGVGDLAGEWRGRWLGPTGHAVAALSLKPDGAYRATLFLDGGDRVLAGVVMPLPSGRLRYQGGDGNGEVRVEAASGGPALRFVPDGGGGGGTFRRAP
jgi:hypothetical protein